MDDFVEIEGHPKYSINRKGDCKGPRKKGILNKPMRHGYVRYTLFDANDKKICITAHRLVGIAFIPNPDNLPYVDHINGIKTDNRVENLRWITHRNNARAHHSKQNNKYYTKYKNKWQVRYPIDDKRHSKHFETEAECISYVAELKISHPLFM